MSIKKKVTPTSAAKIKSNRKNSLKSTGPRTIQGKNKARWNCLQHGLLAKSAIIDLGDRKENREDMQHLIEQLRNDYRPTGTIEEMLIEKIATCYWRLRRCHQAEVGDILTISGSSWNDRKLEREMTYKATLDEYTKNEVSPAWMMKQTSTGLKSLSSYLSEAIKQLKDVGIIASHTVTFIKKIFKDTEVPPFLFNYGKSRRQKIAFLKELTEVFNKLAGQKIDSECLSDHAHIESSRAPRSLNSELLIRYETAIEKRLYRAIHELERLQRIRMNVT